jgi:D-glycero-D-manno-heptose 1,7-bisphosphate phosphatase
LFDERRNKDNIEILKPNYYIKAGDYKESELTSAVYLEPWNGEVKLIPPVCNISSSKIIEKITSPEITEVCKFIFLDRYGTLMKDVPFLYDLEKVELLPGVENLKRLQDIGYKLVIVTNQQGIGLGYFPKEDFYEVNSRLFSLLSAHGLKISKVYYCPHSEADECDCRKPRTGMFKRAKKEMNVDFSKSYMIGDRETDMKAAKLAGVKGLLLKNNWEEIVNKIVNENQ